MKQRRKRKRMGEAVAQNTKLHRELGERVDSSIEQLIKRLQVVEAQVRARGASVEVER